MKKHTCRILLAICFLSILSCSMVKGKGEAEKVAESLFNDRIHKGWSGTNKYYSELFWQNTTENKWATIQNLVSKAMGELNNFSLTTWNIQSKVNTNEISGTIVRFVYETEYENGKGTETLVLHKPVMGKEFSILGHNINSKLIQQLIDKGIEHAASEDSV